jgi:cyclic pyranopterin phosphate synthase
MADLTHIDEGGAAHMVDVSDKAVTTREASATGRITMTAEAATAIAAGDVKKGDVLGTARIAAILAAKRTSDLIPLCHPLPINAVRVDLVADQTGVTCTATVRTSGRTGVEMEALTAASVGLLTVYDMAKALDRSMILGEIRLLAKSGGRSGDWTAE